MIMIKFEHTEVVGWEVAIRGMRNPMNSWDKSDSGYGCCVYGIPIYCKDCTVVNKGSCVKYRKLLIGSNDLNLMTRLRSAGTDHRKFMRMIIVYVDITAPLYWWKEFDTYKVGTVANSCSTMHKIHAKEFTLEDFSTEHLNEASLKTLIDTIEQLNISRNLYITTKDKFYWWQMIQLLPSSYNQKRTVMMSYEVLANQYGSRKNHKLDEWKEHDYLSKEDLSYENTFEKHAGFCDWIRTLPYSELITGKEGE